MYVGFASEIQRAAVNRQIEVSSLFLKVQRYIALVSQRLKGRDGGRPCMGIFIQAVDYPFHLVLLAHVGK